MPFGRTGPQRPLLGTACAHRPQPGKSLQLAGRWHQQAVSQGPARGPKCKTESPLGAGAAGCSGAVMKGLRRENSYISSSNISMCSTFQ